jgi:general secretion pathway protein I
LRIDPRARRAAAGFTLIEVVVAFVLLGLVLSTGFQIFSEGMSRAGMLEERSSALEVARSRLADAGAEEPLKPGLQQGDSGDRRFHWTTSVAPFEEGTDPMHPVPSAYALFRIDVHVAWHGGDGKDHELALSTLGLGPRT